MEAGKAPPQHQPPSLPPVGRVLRRKLRKGTISCWACKRKKVKCTFASASDTTCDYCQRHGKACISQEYPEEAPTPQNGKLQIPAKNPPAKAAAEVKSGNTKPLQEAATPSRGNPPGRASSCSTTLSTTGNGQLHESSQLLHALMPSEADAIIIHGVGQTSPVYFYQINVKSQGMLQDKTPRLPPPTSHPILIIRSMLILVVFLQSVHSDSIATHLSEPPDSIIKRLGDAALGFLANNETLLGNAEGLECLILEGVYHSNTGNIRRAWVVFRRAMLLAQLMGLHRSKSTLEKLHPDNKISAPFVWFRLVYMDRLLCLLLGLPQGSQDISMSLEAALARDTPTGRLERIHTVIAARILERNESEHLRKDPAVTKSIDLELQKAANELPATFWLPPSFDDVEDQHGNDRADNTFQATVRLVNQVYHYSLLNQLHLPCLICPKARPAREFSRLTCANASREILSRFMTYRTFDHATTCCRPLDFFALMAAMTLILAHLDIYQSDGATTLLGHQRQGDRAMMERLLENIQRRATSQHSKDILSEKSAELLRRMLSIEADSAVGSTYTAQRLNPVSTECQRDMATSEVVLVVSIPYFGTIKIARQGIISRESPQPLLGSKGASNGSEPFDGGSINEYYRYPAVGASYTLSQFTTNSEQGGLLPESSAPGAQTSTQTLDHSPLFLDLGDDEAVVPLVQLPSPSFSIGSHQYPGLPTGMVDLDFQGIDMSFFDSLTRDMDIS
ncbi:hypothetical protein BX600DRAFT_477518 [Xylariales sp. PMI_506]|nr:hypothetical protein BX600DRAFT_477518 [Xylariales sp. PMI_506]